MTPDNLNQITQSLRFSWTADYIYDIECYPNFFSFRCTRYSDGAKWCYEISDWCHQGADLFVFLTQVAGSGGRMVGFNNVGYDYPMLHTLMQYQGNVSNAILYNKSQSIIRSENRWENMIWERDRFVPQLDLFMIHHFDNKAKTTSLKLLEFNMMLDNIEELPYDPNYPVTWEQSRHLLEYNDHDVYATMMFYEKSLKDIKFRENLSNKYNKDFMNHNDTKIGKDYFLMELNRAGIKTGKHIQTIRGAIPLSDVIFDYISFEQPEFQKAHRDLYNTVVTDTKGSLHMSAVIDGFSYDFGTGGLHGCVSPQIIRSDDEYIIIDIDYKSFYPNISIRNRVYPEHLTEKFCDVYEDVYNQRVSYEPGTPENKAMKLALNGTYGASNDAHSPFYDPKFTMTITINGQLLLCMLSEKLMQIPEFKMIFVNTDGICCRIPRKYEQMLYDICAESDKHTGLTLEFAKYKMVAIRDCNNYIGVEYD